LSGIFAFQAFFIVKVGPCGCSSRTSSADLKSIVG